MGNTMKQCESFQTRYVSVYMGQELANPLMFLGVRTVREFIQLYWNRLELMRIQYNAYNSLMHKCEKNNLMLITHINQQSNKKFIKHIMQTFRLTHCWPN